jgi:hypothetical protein
MRTGEWGIIMLPGQPEFTFSFPRRRRAVTPPDPKKAAVKKAAASRQRKATDKIVAKKRAELRASRKSREENADV